MNSSHSKNQIAWVNGCLIAVNILYFLLLEGKGSSQNTEVMVKYGALYAPLVNLEKRILSTDNSNVYALWN